MGTLFDLFLQLVTNQGVVLGKWEVNLGCKHLSYEISKAMYNVTDTEIWVN